MVPSTSRKRGSVLAGREKEGLKREVTQNRGYGEGIPFFRDCIRDLLDGSTTTKMPYFTHTRADRGPTGLNLTPLNFKLLLRVFGQLGDRLYPQKSRWPRHFESEMH